MTLARFTIALSVPFLLMACDTSSGVDAPEGCDGYVEPGGNDDEDVQTVFLDAADGDTVCMGEGTFEFTREMTLSANGVVLKGMGQDKTILDFKRQDLGGSGVIISGDGVTIQELTVQNTPGDGVFAKGVEDITFRDMTVLWETKEHPDNGAYGVYPVSSTGVVVDGVTVSGSRDAGIYVGQSNNILVENSVAIDNVAGIEIENSFDAVVRNNEAYDNVGGILVFNLPGLVQKNGERTLVHNNDVYSNNVDNWGVPGTAVAVIPRGTGIIILSADRTEIRDNMVHDNDSIAIAAVGYLIVDETRAFEESDPDFDPYPEANFIHNNTLWNNGTNADELVSGLVPVTPTPELAWDGCPHPDHDNSDGSLTNCFSENADQDGNPSDYFNIDVCGIPPFSNQNQDLAAVTCTHPPIADPF